MKYETKRAILASWPLAMATLVVAGLPWQAEVGVSEAPRAQRAAAAVELLQICRERHPAHPPRPVRPALSRAGDASERSQSPAWMRQHAAELEQCLRDRLLALR